MKTIGYSEFISICKVDELDKWCDWLSIQLDGVYVKQLSEIEYLTYEERSVLTKHPTGKLKEPALSFPCDFEELKSFLEDQSIGTNIDDQYLDNMHDVLEMNSCNDDSFRTRKLANTPWTLRQLKRQNALGNMIYRALKEERDAGRPVPKARDLIEIIEKKKYSEFVGLLDAEIKYFDSNGNIKTANLNSVAGRIKRITTP